MNIPLIIAFSGDSRCAYWIIDLQGRGIRGIFFRGGKVIYPDFFPRHEMLFPVGNFHFGTPKKNFSGFEKWKEKNKTKQHKTTKQKTKTNKKQKQKRKQKQKQKQNKTKQKL